jgi:hypothetical protein
MHRLGFRRPLRGIERTRLVVGPSLVGISRALFLQVLERACDGAPDELRALVASPGCHPLELARSRIIELDEYLLHMMKHMINRDAVLWPGKGRTVTRRGRCRAERIARARLEGTVNRISSAKM